jgi:hypothetical protein
MNCSNDLDKVVHTALHQLSLIEARLAKTGLDPKDAERNVALCLIDAQSTWSLFVRSFFISCFVGAARGGGGHVTTTAPGPYTPADAIRWASVAMDSRLAKKKKLAPLDEPRWHLALTLPRLAQYAKFSNGAQILAAFAVPGQAFDDLPKARNFFAHRSHHTAGTLKGIAGGYRLPATIRAGEIPGHPHVARPGSIAEYWVAQIIATVRLLPT